MKTKNILIKLLSMVCLVVMSTAYAEDMQKNDGLADVALITAKQGKAQNLEKAIAKYHKYMGDKKGAWHYQWYKINSGPNTGSYIARSGGHSWADFDVTNDWDAKARKKFDKTVGPYVENVVASITKTDQDIGIWPESLDGYKYFQITNWHIKSGMGKEFNDGLKKIDAILKKHKWPKYYSFIYTVSGGRGNNVQIVNPTKSYADMAPSDPKFMDVMKKEMGEKDAQAFVKAWGKTYRVGANYRVTYLPEQSNYGDSDK